MYHTDALITEKLMKSIHYSKHLMLEINDERALLFHDNNIHSLLYLVKIMFHNTKINAPATVDIVCASKLHMN